MIIPNHEWVIFLPWTVKLKYSSTLAGVKPAISWFVVRRVIHCATEPLYLTKWLTISYSVGSMIILKSLAQSKQYLFLILWVLCITDHINQKEQLWVVRNVQSRTIMSILVWKINRDKHCNELNQSKADENLYFILLY